MLFVIAATDRQNSIELRKATRDTHLAYLERTGVVKLAGPFMDANGNPAGSLLIVDVADQHAAVEWASNDPYAKADLFASVDISAWKATVNNCGAQL
ncbi:MAG TPA: YciI family protein [Rhizomicrobium sp.]|jgi:hypothetical protein|nr:YciI family protein [Rhizomicrobium sp.]HEX4534410.1 YciI family protein [Rhizomicrobium sp.]